MNIVSVSPFRCRVWSLHDRLQENVTEETCKEEIESFIAHGQRVPALGRVLKGDPDYDLELIYGARRLFAARLINKPLLVEVRDITDQDAIIAMDIENRQRKDVSPYERGLSYSRWLGAGYFSSQEDLARRINTSASQVSRLLKLAKLPAVIVNAFSSPVDIREEWGLELIETLNDANARRATIQTARAIASRTPRMCSREVIRELLAASADGRKVKARPHDEVVHSADGRPLFRIRQQRRTIAVLLPVQIVSAGSMKVISNAVAEILQGQSEFKETAKASAASAHRNGWHANGHGHRNEDPAFDTLESGHS
jgi:ParB family chromosome partitioning protein